MCNAIKIRLLQLGKKQIDLLPELEERGFHLAPTQVSLYINHAPAGRQPTAVLEAVEEILQKWEVSA